MSNLTNMLTLPLTIGFLVFRIFLEIKERVSSRDPSDQLAACVSIQLAVREHTEISSKKSITQTKIKSTRLCQKENALNQDAKPITRTMGIKLKNLFVNYDTHPCPRGLLGEWLSTYPSGIPLFGFPLSNMASQK